MPKKTEFAQWLSSKRKDFGNQDEVATKMGISRSALARWETGRNVPSVELLPNIADCLNVSLEEVARRAGMQAEVKYSEFSLSLARMIECKTAGLSEERKKAVAMAVDSVVTAYSF
jgi:transcriptional regulator with XRE-family HTH domain